MVVALVVSVFGSWFSLLRGLVIVVDQGSGSTTVTCSLELGVSFARCLSSSLGGNGFLVGLSDVGSVLSRILSFWRNMAEFSWMIGVSALLDA